MWTKRMIKSCHKQVESGSDEEEVKKPDKKIETSNLCDFDKITDRSSINSDHSEKQIVVEAIAVDEASDKKASEKALDCNADE